MRRLVFCIPLMVFVPVMVLFVARLAQDDTPGKRVGQSPLLYQDYVAVVEPRPAPQQPIFDFFNAAMVVCAGSQPYIALNMGDGYGIIAYMRDMPRYLQIELQARCGNQSI